MAVLVGITWQDAYGRTTHKRYENTRTLLADMLTDATALKAAMADISDAGRVKQEISHITADIVAAGAGSNVDSGATLHCRLDNGKLYPLKVPMIKAALLNADGTVKIDDADLETFVALFESAGYFRVSEGNYVVAVEYGELDK